MVRGYRNSRVLEILENLESLEVLEAYKKRDLSKGLFFVVPPGIEPGTQGFSVLCSTN